MSCRLCRALRGLFTAGAWCAMAVMSPVLAQSSEGIDLSVGQLHESAGVVLLWRRPVSGLRYQVLSRTGKPVFAALARRVVLEGCDPPRHAWTLRPLSSGALRQTANRPLVVGLEDERTLDAVPVASVDPVLAQAVVQRLMHAHGLTAANTTFAVVSAGRVEQRTRLVFVLTQRKAAQSRIEASYVTVVDLLEGTIVRLSETFVHGSSLRVEHAGHSDLNGDGFADVFVVNYGDADGSHLFIETDGRWRRRRDDSPGPC